MTSPNIVPNRELFNDFLEMELKRSLRYQNFTSLLLIEASSKEAVYKNENGLTLTEKMATLIRKELRETDIIGAFDGSTITIVLLHSDKHIAHTVGDRLKGWMSNYFGVEGNNSQVCFNLGGACFPSDATDLKGLYRKVFEMLDRAKAQGGNCVQTSD